MTIYTHVNPDMDAVFSVAALRLVQPQWQDVMIELVPANWDGVYFKEGDIALDIPAGGKGFKGVKDPETGRMGSAFEGVIRMYGTPDDQEALRNLVAYIEGQDSQGAIGVAQMLVGDDREKISHILKIPDLGELLAIWKHTYGANDMRIFEAAGEYLRGYRSLRQKEMALFHVVDQQTQFFAGGRLAYTTAVYGEAVRYYLFLKGVDWVVYSYDNCLGIKRNENMTMRADHPDIRAVVEKYKEQDEWFAHSAGFLYCRGTTKAPVETPSKVDPMELVAAVEALITQD